MLPCVVIGAFTLTREQSDVAHTHYTNSLIDQGIVAKVAKAFG